MIINKIVGRLNANTMQGIGGPVAMGHNILLHDDPLVEGSVRVGEGVYVGGSMNRI